jgi:hypothetical protein
MKRVFLSLLVLAIHAPFAWATSFSESSLGYPLFTQDIGTTSSLIQSGENLAGSFVIPVNGAMGAILISDNSVSSLTTRASHVDDWSCTSGCGAAVAPAIAASIGFDAVLKGNIARGVGELQLTAIYTIGSDVFRLDASADSTPVEAGATFNGDSVPVTMTFDQDGNLHLFVNFIRIVHCPCSSNGGENAPLIDDQQRIAMEMEGAGTFDASHTFTVTLTPLDSAIVLTSADGRVAGSAPAASPIPEPTSLLLLGTCLLPLARRLRRV